VVVDFNDNRIGWYEGRRNASGAVRANRVFVFQPDMLYQTVVFPDGGRGFGVIVRDNDHALALPELWGKGSYLLFKPFNAPVRRDNGP
jgi:hypothetical protein